MPNPFRSEESAFRFVWLTIGYFALIVGAWWISHWFGIAVFVLLSAGLAYWLLRRGELSKPHEVVEPALPSALVAGKRKSELEVAPTRRRAHSPNG